MTKAIIYFHWFTFSILFIICIIINISINIIVIIIIYRDIYTFFPLFKNKEEESVMHTYIYMYQFLCQHDEH